MCSTACLYHVFTSIISEIVLLENFRKISWSVLHENEFREKMLITEVPSHTSYTDSVVL